jgi:hypothetical protein
MLRESKIHIDRKGEKIISQGQHDQKYKAKRMPKSAIQFELDVNGINDEDFFHVSDIDQYQPAKTPSVLCSHTHFKLINWYPQTIFTVVDKVLNRCNQISYEYIETDFKVTISPLPSPNNLTDVSNRSLRMKPLT